MDELNNCNNVEKELLKSALEARKNSHSPYSKFKVGASILTTDDEIFSGCNVKTVLTVQPFVLKERQF